MRRESCVDSILRAKCVDIGSVLWRVSRKCMCAGGGGVEEEADCYTINKLTKWLVLNVHSPDQQIV